MLPPLSEDRLAPLEFVVIAFEGDQFTGDILPALAELMADGLVRVIDMAFVSKLADGSVSILELQELTPDFADALTALVGEVQGLLTEGDLAEVAEDIDPGMTAATLLVEHLWLGRFARAVRAANGELLLSERIPHDVAEGARQAIIDAAALPA